MKQEKIGKYIHVLKAIKELLDSKRYARITDIAKLLGTNKGRISEIVKKFVESEIVAKENGSFITITDKGYKILKESEHNNMHSGLLCDIKIMTSLGKLNCGKCIL